MPVLAQQVGEIGGDVGLAPAGEPHVDDLLEAGVGRRASSGEPLELVVVLDGPQHRQLRVIET